MKKFISLIIMASAMMLAGTQASAQMSIGAGYLNSSARTKIGDNVNNAPLNGFYAGADYLITEGTGFGINVGAYYSYISSTESMSGSVFGALLKGSTKTTEMYLDIPVNVNLSTDLSDGLRGFIYVGPTFSLGLSSNAEASASIGSIGGSTGKKDLYSDTDYNRFDILVGGGVGIDYNSIRLKIGYDMGMLNRYDRENMTVNRNILHVGLAYIF